MFVAQEGHAAHGGAPEAPDRAAFWDTIFSVLGPFDVFHGTARDPLLRSRRELLVQVFRLVDHPENLAVSVAAMHVISDICDSPAFEPGAAAAGAAPHRVYSILEAAGELPGVMAAFVRRLEREETEQATLEDAAPSDDALLAAFGLANYVRLQIVDFLIRNAAKPGYNIAHYLLGFPQSAILGAADALPLPPAEAQADSASFTALHIIVELLSYGLGQPSTPIVALDHPSLGERCYALLSVLLSHRATAAALSAYLRGPEDALLARTVAAIAREPVDQSDAAYTRLECLQKKHVFAALAADTHVSLSDAGAFPHVLRTLRALLGESCSSASGDAKASRAESPLVAHMAALHGLASGAGDFRACASEALAAACALCRTALSPGLQAAAPHRRGETLRAQCGLASRLVPVLARILQAPSSDASVVEAASLASLAAVPFFAGTYTSGSDALSAAAERVLGGDELCALQDAALAVVLRPAAAGILARAASYAVLLATSPGNGSVSQGGGESATPSSAGTVPATSPGNSRLPQRGVGTLGDMAVRTGDAQCVSASARLDRRDAARVVEVAGADATLSGRDADAWKALAAAFLCEMLLAPPGKERLAPEDVVDRLVRLGVLRTLVADMAADDAAVAGGAQPRSWAVRLALLLRVATVPRGVERLLEAGLADALCALRVLSRCDAGLWGAALPVLQLVRVLASSGEASALAAAAAFVQSPAGQRVLPASLEAAAPGACPERTDAACEAARIFAAVAAAYPGAFLAGSAALLPAVFGAALGLVLRLIDASPLAGVASASGQTPASAASGQHICALLLALGTVMASRGAHDPSFVCVAQSPEAGCASPEAAGRMLVWAVAYATQTQAASAASHDALALPALCQLVAALHQAHVRAARRLAPAEDVAETAAAPRAAVVGAEALAALASAEDLLLRASAPDSECSARAVAAALRSIRYMRAAEAADDAAAQNVFQY